MEWKALLTKTDLKEKRNERNTFLFPFRRREFLPRRRKKKKTLQCRRSSAAGAPRRRSSLGPPQPPGSSRRPRSSSSLAATCPGRSSAPRRQGSGEQRSIFFIQKAGGHSPFQGRDDDDLCIDLALSPRFPCLVAPFLVARGLRDSRSNSSRRRKSRMRASERARDALKGDTIGERKRERKRHADRKQKKKKNSQNPINSRASLYPVSSLSLSRAPCLLEENELPVAQWQEYDKAFTCVSGVLFLCFLFRRRQTLLLLLWQSKRRSKKKARPPALSPSLPFLILRDAR